MTTAHVVSIVSVYTETVTSRTDTKLTQTCLDYDNKMITDVNYVNWDGGGQTMNQAARNKTWSLHAYVSPDCDQLWSESLNVLQRKPHTDLCCSVKRRQTAQDNTRLESGLANSHHKQAKEWENRAVSSTSYLLKVGNFFEREFQTFI